MIKKTLSVLLVLLLVFCSLPSFAVTFPENYTVGDVNKDSNVTSIDYIILRKYFQGVSIDSAFTVSADVNNDGSITSADYLIIKQILAGNTVTLVYPKRLEAQPAINEPGTNFSYKVSGTVTNNAVFQRYKYISVTGTSNATGRAVYAKLGNETRYGIVDSTGHFEILLNAQKENTTSQTLYVYNAYQGQNGGKKFTGILIGDVWMLVGQSNAQISLNGTLSNNSSFTNTISTSQKIRLFTQWFWDCTQYFIEDTSIDDFKRQNGIYISQDYRPQDNPPSGTKWNTNSTTNAKNFSAVGYYFAKKVADNTNVPIGIIQCVAGGSALYNFMPPSGYTASYKRGSTQFNACDIYNCLMAPFSKTNIKGMIFYQGEGNEGCYQYYASDLAAYVGMMRNIWGSDMEFYNVQLTSHGSQCTWGGLSDVRFAQYDAISLIDNYDLITSMDYGYQSSDSDWAHPSNKKHIGDRLAYVALSKIYSPNSFSLDNYGSPMVDHVVRNGQYVDIYFKNVGSGLTTYNGSTTVSGFQNYATKANLSATITANNCVRVNLGTSSNINICYGYGSQSDYKTDTLRNSNGIGALAFKMLISQN